MKGAWETLPLVSWLEETPPAAGRGADDVHAGHDERPGVAVTHDFDGLRELDLTRRDRRSQFPLRWRRKGGKQKPLAIGPRCIKTLLDAATPPGSLPASSRKQ